MQRAETQGPAPPEPMSDALEAFSRELAVRFPDREIKRFVLPRAIRKHREIFIREIGTRDGIEAATMADSLMGPLERASVRLTNEAEERECVRLAIVGFGDAAADGAVSYWHTNTNKAIPLAEIDGWPKALMDATTRYFNIVNGLPPEEFIAGILEARTVGAFAPPTSAIRASADPGRPGG